MSGANWNDEGHEAFVLRAKEVLDEGNAHLDARVRSRLTRARHAALEQARPRPFWMHQWAPAAGVAVAAVLAVLVWPGAHDPVGGNTVKHEAAYDLEIVLAEENLELFENLDFYEWVDAESGSI
jgi:hypothetical protein